MNYTIFLSFFSIQQERWEKQKQLFIKGTKKKHVLAINTFQKITNLLRIHSCFFGSSSVFEEKQASDIW